MFIPANLTHQIIERIKFGVESVSNKEIAKNIVAFWRNSQQILDMLTAQKYHLVENEEIDTKSRDYLVPVFHEDGTVTEERRTNDTLSNVKLKNAFMRVSVEQKVNYGFTKPFVVEVSQEGVTAGDEEPADLIAYRNAWNEFLSNKTRETIKRIAIDAFVNGKGWAYVTVDDEMNLVLIDTIPNTVYPEWSDRSHTDLDIAVRDYTIIYYVSGQQETVRKVEFWDKDTVEFFIDDGGEWLIDTDMEAYFLGDTLPPEDGGIPHLKTIGWGKVPFICLKSNPDELPLLNIVKSYVDIMDGLKSKMGDSLMDDMDAVLMVKGLTPRMQELIRSRYNIQNSGIVSIDAEKGDMKYIKNDISVDAVIKALEDFYRDLLQYSSTVDLRGDSQALRQTIDALKMAYQPLDIYMNGMESLFRQFMGQVKYFFDKSLEFRGMGTPDKWANFKMTFTLDRDMMVSESQIIDNIMKLGSELSQETRDAQNPYVIDHATEQARRDSETEKQLNQMRLERKNARTQEGEQ